MAAGRCKRHFTCLIAETLDTEDQQKFYGGNRNFKKSWLDVKLLAPKLLTCFMTHVIEGVCQ